MTRSRDELEPLDDWPPDPRVGSASTADGDGDEPHEHPAGSLYVPDLSERTGWGYHTVPKPDAARAPRAVGFRRR